MKPNPSLQFSFVTVLFLLLVCLEGQSAPSANDPFAFVFIDRKTEKKLGNFPYSRVVLAQGFQKLREARVKAVVLKFFLDQAKDAPGDQALAHEMKQIPTLLQARLDPEEANPNPILRNSPSDQLLQTDEVLRLRGDSGWIPLPVFQNSSVGIGFVDMPSAEDPGQLPLGVLYKGEKRPSLWVLALELAKGRKALISERKLGGITLNPLIVQEGGMIRVDTSPEPNLKFHSFLDLLEGRLSQKSLEGKIVILGYEGESAPFFTTPHGALSGHRLFGFTLVHFFSRL